jgi:glycosyltransferase involved in cell wall biosynthesis
MQKLRIAAFGGFRSIPPKAGGAGSDKFALELYPRIVQRGHSLVAYCRIYPDDVSELKTEYKGIKLRYFKTVNKSGFDTLIHSCKATFDIIFNNRADVIHLHSGANSIWAVFLRLAGKKVFVSQFAMDWKRDKWPWYGKLFYLFSNYLTAYIPNRVIFDNIYTKEYFEKKFNKNFDFIPYGCEVDEPKTDHDIFVKLGLEPKKYFLFVGRFIPDKGLHLLVEAFRNVETDFKLVLVGGSPNPSEYEKSIKQTTDDRIVFPGFVYGETTNNLMKNAYTYIQPSLIEGLSPVILTVMGLGTPLICSDIVENLYITNQNAIHFKSGSTESLALAIKKALTNPNELETKAKKGQIDIKTRFNWETITDNYINILKST